jgi:hypothetical protein
VESEPARNLPDLVLVAVELELEVAADVGAPPEVEEEGLVIDVPEGAAADGIPLEEGARLNAPTGGWVGPPFPGVESLLEGLELDA